nr:zinc finger, CCHC-type, retrotransposon Gag domain protein [Tanacetum cinerariifolium]
MYKFEGDALAWWKAYKQAKGGDDRLKREYHSIRQTDTETSMEFMQRFLRLVGFLGAAAGTAEEQEKNFQWGLRMYSVYGYKRQKSGDRHQPTTQQSSHRSHGQNNDHQGSDRCGGSDNHCSSNNNNKYSGRIPAMDVTKETGVISPTDLPILVPSNPGVPLRVTPIQFALLVDVDIKESVVELK